LGQSPQQKPSPSKSTALPKPNFAPENNMSPNRNNSPLNSSLLAALQESSEQLSLNLSTAITPPSTPLKSILSPRSNRFGSAKKNIVWREVEVRPYYRTPGSCSIPHAGAFPLGLDWEYNDKKVERVNIIQYEKKKETRRRSSGELAMIPEKMRKQILLPQIKQDLKSVSELHEEIKEIRLSRNSGHGCNCDGECNTDDCICFAHGITCSENEKGCICTSGTCKNPKSKFFDDELVDRERKKKIKQHNRFLERQKLLNKKGNTFV